MIRFYRTRDCPACGHIEETMQDMTLAHETHTVSSVRDLPDDVGSVSALPVLVDGDRVIEGKERIVAHLEELADFKAQWEKFQSDACYCGPGGEPEDPAVPS
jgi:hypothetical protein